MEARAVSSLREIMQCPICLETFKDPKMLPCVHTFCLQCLQMVCENIDSGDDMACPMCRKDFQVPAGGMQDLPSNIFMNQLQDINAASTTVVELSSEVVDCELCFETAATSFCVECEQRICSRCSVIHKNQKMSKAHQVVNMKNMPSGLERARMIVSYCKVHPDEQIKLYCYDCKTIACGMCYFERHNNHECTDVKKSAHKFREQLQVDIDKMETSLVVIRKELDELEMSKETFIENVKDTQKMISLKCEELMAMVKSHECDLFKELDLFKNNQLKEMESRVTEVKRRLVMRESLMKYCQELKDGGTASDISHNASILHSRTDELVENENEQSFHVPGASVITFVPSVVTQAKNLIGELSFKDDAMKYEELEQFFQATAFLDEPALLRVIPRNGAIFGVTVLNEELLVVRATQEVDVYNANSFALMRNLSVSGSKSLSAIASSRYNKSVYMSDDGKRMIYQYNHRLNKIINQWPVSGLCLGLSVTKDQNLLVTIYNAKQIQEYGSNGTLLREIRLDSESDYPVHCVQLSTDLFVYSHQGKERSGVSVVDSAGCLLLSYCQLHGSELGEMNRPRHIAVDSHDNVIVTDWLNNRIELLSPELHHLGYIAIPEHGLHMPWALHLDSSKKRLYIGERAGERLFVLNAVLW